ncbi:E3 ubiquitin protein ligase [Phanerochaete sordida]|uniref:E3 ubiquitin protein ligase n=1 Tax=Phanerochaete sordida TaxID=48140 RepID=A0A9P3GCB9_9APHY|nr:E3 ubiquitin protein ligase [Phanerochaete sordida]
MSLPLLLASWIALLAFSTSLPRPVHAYIPASPTNDTGTSDNSTSPSHLVLTWFGGGYSEAVSYQLVGADSDGISKGALVHFSELKLSDDLTTTPWIALVSCDDNSTDASMEDDIFTLARDRGAVSALLYSVYSERCVINSDYANPENFDQVMDIFSSPSLSASQMIEVEYKALNQSQYQNFNATLLNETAAVVNATLTNGTIKAPNYLFATLIASNATGDPNTGLGGSNTGDSTDGDNPPSNPRSSLAMIILYAITGCVSALFCVVIISGAIRAIRHPERYGPRAGGATFGPGGTAFITAPQSRARGVTRAILDTFPIVKFGRADDAGVAVHVPKDVEAASADGKAHSEELELAELPAVQAILAADGADSKEPGSGVSEEARDVHDAPEASSSSQPPTPIVRPRIPAARKEATTASAISMGDQDLVPDAIGRETCPICIVDFEEGDDLRVLPCEGHHRFHQQCVDQWLLELSSSCPLCRQDFHVLENMMHSSDDHVEHLPLPAEHGSSRPLSTAGARFSRYIRLARRTRRRNRNREGVPHGYDPTNPPMPPAPETAL